MKKQTWLITIFFNVGVIRLAETYLTETVKNEITNLQNTLRRNFANGAVGGHLAADMAKLSWSDHLETIAQETLEIKCSYEFSPLDELLRDHISWDSNFRTNSNGNFTGDIHSWYSEILTSTFLHVEGHVFACIPYNNCQQAYMLLHSKHKRTGCAYKRHCRGNNNVFLCLYDKERELSPESFFSPGPVCSRCDDAQPFCDEGLCVSCNSNVTSCDCRKTCRYSGVGLGTLHVNSCTCNCAYGLGPNCDEPCENRNIAVDYDICDTVSMEECNDPTLAQMLAYHCPERCGVCRRYPSIA